jgi:hypothetical protein
MASHRRSYENRLKSIMDGLAESVAEASDEELLEESGRDEAPLEAERVRRVLIDAVRATSDEVSDELPIATATRPSSRARR